MWLYFNSSGTLTTQVYNGEKVRQNGTFTLYIAFDLTLCDSAWQASHTIQVQGQAIDGTIASIVTLDGTSGSTLSFTQRNTSEATYDLVSGNSYWVYTVNVPASLQYTALPGNRKIIVTVTDTADVSQTYPQGLVNVYVEPTYGGDKVQLSYSEYQTLLAKISSLSGYVALGTIYGTGSLAGGTGSIAGASGQSYTGITAYGISSIATGNASSSYGASSTASGAYSIVCGCSSVSSAQYGISIGYQSTSSKSGICIGYRSAVSGLYGVSIGLSSMAYADGSVAVGCYTESGNYYGAMNFIPNTVTFDGVASGSVHPNMILCLAYPSNLFFRNSDNLGNANDTIASYTAGKTLQDYLDGISSDIGLKQEALVSGTNIKTVNGQSILGSGDLTVSGSGDYVPLGTVYGTGAGNLAGGTGSVAGTSGQNYTKMTAYGASAKASGNYSTAIGSASTASGDFSTASGYGSTANGYGSNASGNFSTASGYGSTASGNGSTASGSYSTASGYGSNANGYGSNASGYNSNSSGYGSTASGYNSTASGYNSTASGYNSKASGNGSTAIGSLYLSPNAFGSYNNINNSVTFDGQYNSSYPTVHPNAIIHFGYLSDIYVRNSDQTSTANDVANIFSAYPSAHNLQEYVGAGSFTVISVSVAGLIANSIAYFSVTGTGTSADPYIVTPKGPIYAHMSSHYVMAISAAAASATYIQFRQALPAKCMLTLTCSVDSSNYNVAFYDIDGNMRPRVTTHGNVASLADDYYALTSTTVITADVDDCNIWHVSY